MIRTLLIVAATALLGLLLVAGGPVSAVVPSLTPSVATGRGAISISPAPSAEDELSLAEPALGVWLTR